MLTTGQSDVHDALSCCLGHAVTLESAAPEQPSLEEYWPDMEELDHRDTVTDEGMSAGTFSKLVRVFDEHGVDLDT